MYRRAALIQAQTIDACSITPVHAFRWFRDAPASWHTSNDARRACSISVKVTPATIHIRVLIMAEMDELSFAS